MSLEDDLKPPLSLPDAVQCYVLGVFGRGDAMIGRDLLLSLARRVAYAREVHPRFGGMASVCAEFDELKRAYAGFGASGDPRRLCEEALDVMATCIRLVNFEEPSEEDA